MIRLLGLIFFTLISFSAFSQTITGSTSFCQGGSTTLTVTGAPGGSTYQWRISTDGGTTWADIFGATAVNYNVTSPASYTVIVTTAGIPTTLTAVVVTQNPRPVVDFTFNNDNTCSGTAIQFTSIVTSGTAPFTYAWDFGGTGNSTAQNPIHSFTSLGCGTMTFSVALVVTDVNGCSGTITKTITVKQKPDVQVIDQSHPFSPFSNCSNSPSTSNPNFSLTIANTSPNAACITSYSVDWGDGVVQNLPPQTFPLAHTYTQLGTFNLVVTAVGNNGCSNSKTYVVVNQSNPAVGISGPGGTSGCAPIGFWFKVTNFQLNSPGTIYRWDFGDGSPPVVWTTPITVDSIFHTFTTTSCTRPGNQFTVRVKAINGCDSTEATVNNIKIFKKPVANFNSPATACITTAVLFTNTTIEAYNQGNCNRTTTYSWNFGDPSSSQNTSTTTSPTHIFSAPGNYTVTLIATGSCGNDTITRPICIVAAATSIFSINNPTGCSPLSVNATNSSGTLSDCTPATYLWTVSYSATNCGTGPSYAFTGGTNSASINPSFIFNNPGTYTITLSVTNACGTITSNKIVTIKKPPTVSLAIIPAQCAPATINPSANVTNCGAGPLSYSWTFAGGSPASSTSANPGPIIYNTPGTYTVSLIVTNECGSTTVTQPFTVSAQPSAPTASNNGPLCSGNTLNLSASSSTPGVTYSWTGPGGFTSAQQNPVRTNATTAMSGTYTVTINSNGCTITATTNVVINQTPVNPVVTSPINYCQNATAVPLTATSTPGNSLNWYTVATGGTASTTPPTPNTATIGSTTYYVSQINTTSPQCESARVPIVVNVSAIPIINGSSTNPTTCSSTNGTIIITGLTPNTSYSIQYVKDNGTPTTVTLTSNASGVIIITNLSGGTYTNITASLSGCTSNAIGPFILVSPAAPTAPTVNNNGPLCSGSTLTLSATSSSGGATYSWTGPGGFTSSVQNPTRSNATVAMSGTYSVTVTLNGCTSAPTTTNVSIIQTPTNPAVTSPVNYCQNDIAAQLTASGSPGNSLNWYNVPTGGTANPTAPIPVTSSIGSTTYYVSQLTTTTPACESGRAPIIVNVYAVPNITGSFTSPTNCLLLNGSITLNGLVPNTTYSVRYTKDGGTPTIVTLTSNASGVIIINNLSAGDYSNITVTLNGCPSNPLGTFHLVNPSAPAAPLASSNGPLCSGGTLNLTASSSVPGVTYSWNGPGGFTSTAQNPVRTNASAAMSGNYNVTVTLNGCTSASATTNAIVIQTPTNPIVISPVNYCQNAAASPLTATTDPGNLLKWYTTPTGGVGNTTAPTPGTSTIGSTTYYVSQLTVAAPGCESGRTPIVVNVYAVPSINGNPTGPTNCLLSDGNITLSGLSPNTTYTIQYIRDGGSPTTITLTSNATGVIVISNLPVGNYTNITATLNGCSSNAIGPFLLANPTTPAAPSAINNGPLCSGATLNLMASSLVTGVSYLWTGPSGFTSALQNPVRSNSTATMSGVYSVTVILNGCVSTAATTNVVINQTPSNPAATSTINYCHNATPTPLTATGIPGNILYWHTTATGGTSSITAPVPNTSIIGSTTYYVSQYNSLTTCESARTPIIVTIDPIPVIGANSSPPTTCNSSNGTITLTGLSANNPYNVKYTVNGVNISAPFTANTNGNIIINNLSAGTYSNLSATFNGCSSNVLGPFVLINPSVPSTPTAGSNSPLCIGSTLILAANSTTPGVSYSWSGPGGFMSSSQNPNIPNIQATASGRYYVTARSNTCISEKDSVDVVINIDPIVNLGPDLVLPPGTQHVLTSTIQNGPIVQYTWTPSTNLSCTNCPRPTATIQSNISYSVQVTNANGCKAKDTINIQAICEKAQIYIPNAFSPDSDGINDLLMVRSVGLVTVKYFRIFNKWGELVFERNNFSTNDASNGWNGKIKGVYSPPDVFVYTIEVMCENGTPFFFKGNVTILK